MACVEGIIEIILIQSWLNRYGRSLLEYGDDYLGKHKCDKYRMIGFGEPSSRMLVGSLLQIGVPVHYQILKGALI